MNTSSNLAGRLAALALAAFGFAAQSDAQFTIKFRTTLWHDETAMDPVRWNMEAIRSLQMDADGNLFAVGTVKRHFNELMEIENADWFIKRLFCWVDLIARNRRLCSSSVSSHRL